MENKIHKRFLDEASRIRIDYLNELKKFESKEEDLKQYQNKLTDLLNNIEKYINENNNTTEEEITEDLKVELSEIEVNMNIIQKEVSILEKKVKKLRKESSTLYKAIKEKHPELSEQDIQHEILYSIKE